MSDNLHVAEFQPHSAFHLPLMKFLDTQIYWRKIIVMADTEFCDIDRGIFEPFRDVCMVPILLLINCMN